jgi:hypothetical protein
MHQYLQACHRRFIHGDPLALQQADDAVRLGYGPSWLGTAWQQAYQRPRREEWRGFTVYLVSQFERSGRTRQRAFAEAGVFIGCSAGWVEALFRQPASRLWLKLFRIPVRRPPLR